MKFVENLKCNKTLPTEINIFVKIVFNVKFVIRSWKILIIVWLRVVINVKIVEKQRKIIKFVIFAKNQIKEESGYNVHDNSAINGFTRIVIDIFNPETICLKKIIKKFISVLFAEKFKEEN